MTRKQSEVEMVNRIPYVYEIEHIESSKKYIGSRTRVGCNPDELMVEGGYTTSSKFINYIINNDGLSSFKINWIETFSSKDDALMFETNLLKKINARDNEDYLNQHNNDGVANMVKRCKYHNVDCLTQLPEIREKNSKGNKGRKVSDETKDKIRRTLKEYHQSNPDIANQISERNKGMQSPNKGRAMSDDQKDKISISRKKLFQDNPDLIVRGKEHPQYGKKLSEKTLAKLSESTKNLWKDETYRLKVIEGLKAAPKRDPDSYKRGEEHPMYGKPKTEEHKQNMRKPKRKATCPHCGKEGGVSQMRQWHFDNCKVKNEK